MNQITEKELLKRVNNVRIITFVIFYCIFYIIVVTIIIIIIIKNVKK